VFETLEEALKASSSPQPRAKLRVGPNWQVDENTLPSKLQGTLEAAPHSHFGEALGTFEGASVLDNKDNLDFVPTPHFKGAFKLLKTASPSLVSGPRPAKLLR
jgi:hypothetical protein